VVLVYVDAVLVINGIWLSARLAWPLPATAAEAHPFFIQGREVTVSTSSPASSGSSLR
jgi:hypothetical protein